MLKIALTLVLSVVLFLFFIRESIVLSGFSAFNLLFVDSYQAVIELAIEVGMTYLVK